MSKTSEYVTYNEEDNRELRKLQLVELDILRIFSEICEKYNLRYYMVGGTLLGAIRHKGFIPWDDDTDIAMPRPDYERFLKIAKDVLPEGYDIQNYKTDDTYNRYFSRVVNKNVRIYNGSNTKMILEYAWMDIYTYDGMPANPVRRQFHFWRMLILRFFYHASCFEELVNLNRPGRPGYQKLIIRFLSRTHFGSKLNTKKIMLYIEHLMKKYPYESSEYIVCFFGAYLQKEIIPKKWLGKNARYTFESLQLPGPKYYDTFLKHYFGDYMTPPKNKGEAKHNIVKIEYLNGEDENYAGS